MKNFAFDLYGTLVDIHTDEEEGGFRSFAARSFFELCGGECDFWKEYVRLCAPPMGEEYYEPDLLEVFAALSRLCGGEVDKSELAAYAYGFRRASRKRLGLYPHVKEILTGLKERGANVYLLSNAQACFTYPELEEVGIGGCFDGVLLSSEAGVKKPSVRFFNELIERFSLDRGETVYTGNDYGADVCGSKGAGLYSVYINTYDDTPLERVYGRADRVCLDHGELKNTLFEIAERGI